MRPHAEERSFRPDVEVARRAAIEKGVLSTDDLRECGLNGDAVAVRERNGRLHRIYRGVYAVGHANPGVEGCFMAAVKAFRPRSALSHFAAAAYREYLRWDRRARRGHDPERSTLPAAGHQGPPKRGWDSIDFTRLNGIPITSSARTLLDLARSIAYERLRRAINQALSLKDVTVGELAEVLGRLGPRRGSKNFAKLLARRSGAHPQRARGCGRRVAPRWRLYAA